jgi:hypothetical protein
VSFSDYLADATSLEAQLALSYLVWPKDAPAPRVVDEWCSVYRLGKIPG